MGLKFSGKPPVAIYEPPKLSTNGDSMAMGQGTPRSRTEKPIPD